MGVRIPVNRGGEVSIDPSAKEDDEGAQGRLSETKETHVSGRVYRNSSFESIYS